MSLSTSPHDRLTTGIHKRLIDMGQEHLKTNDWRLGQPIIVGFFPERSHFFCYTSCS